MTKDFDLTSPSWLDMIFEKRNKQYGAYALRADSSNRHLKSLAVVAILGLAAIFLPKVIQGLAEKDDNISTYTEIDMTDFAKQNIPDEPEEIVQPVEPPPSLVAQVKYTEAIIVEDNKIQEENLSKANEELANLDADIGKDKVEGTGTTHRSEENTPSPPPPTPEPKIYRVVDQKASFPGGDVALTKWLSDNLRYPQSAIDAEQRGSVQVEFVVRSNGKIDGIKVVQSSGHATLDREAKRLIEQMSKEKTWLPAKRNGDVVDSYFICPINFKMT